MEVAVRARQPVRRAAQAPPPAHHRALERLARLGRQQRPRDADSCRGCPSRTRRGRRARGCAARTASARRAWSACASARKRASAAARAGRAASSGPSSSRSRSSQYRSPSAFSTSWKKSYGVGGRDDLARGRGRSRRPRCGRGEGSRCRRGGRRAPARRGRPGSRGRSPGRVACGSRRARAGGRPPGTRSRTARRSRSPSDRRRLPPPSERSASTSTGSPNTPVARYCVEPGRILRGRGPSPSIAPHGEHRAGRRRRHARRHAAEEEAGDARCGRGCP